MKKDTSHTVPKWTPNQLRLIDWLALPKPERDPGSQEELADLLGLNRKTLSRWKKLPGFEQAVIERSRDMLKFDLNEIYGALRKEAKAGSYQHIKLALELTGEHTDRQIIDHTGALEIVRVGVDTDKV